MFLDKVVSSCGRILVGTIKQVTVTPVRNRYVTWFMRKDIKRRGVATEYSDLRSRLLAMKKSKVLPDTITNDAQMKFDALPKFSMPKRATNLCVVTGRLRGVVLEHRLSRIMFRLLADYNKMSGIIRAKW